jgi:flagellar hook-associated protein 1 FlgK
MGEYRGGPPARPRTLIGLPDDAASLSARLAEFEARLIDAANGPHDEIRLGAAVEVADALARTFGTISDGIQASRERADAAIGEAVTEINQSLAGIAELNARIRAIPDRSGDLSSLLDAQTRLVDQLARHIPLQTRRDAAGALQVFSTGGEILRRPEGRRAGVPDHACHRHYNGFRQLDPFGNPDRRPRDRFRDVHRTSRRRRSRGVVRAARHMGPGGAGASRRRGARSCRTVRDTGPRSDAPANRCGVVHRWGHAATRDGTGAFRPHHGQRRGAPGGWRRGVATARRHRRHSRGRDRNATLLLAQVDACRARVTASGRFTATARTMADLVSDHVSTIGLARQGAEDREANSAAVQSALRQQELSRGVDTDAEMQNLIRIEQMYAANARVVQAAEAMLDELMRMTR